MSPPLPLLFLSHADVNRDLAKLTKHDLLVDACGVPDDRVWSSSDGSIKPGTAWKESILDALTEAHAVLFLVTPQFKESQFCAFEVGAAWCLKKPIIALIPHGGSSKDLGLLLSDYQGIRLADTTDLSRLRDQLAAVGYSMKTERWEERRKRFLDRLKEIPSPFDVPPAKPAAVQIEPAPSSPPKKSPATEKAQSTLLKFAEQLQRASEAHRQAREPDPSKLPPAVRTLIDSAYRWVLPLQRITCKVIGTSRYGKTAVTLDIAMADDTYQTASQKGEVSLINGRVVVRDDRAYVKRALEALDAINDHFKKNQADREAYEFAMKSAADLSVWEFWHQNFGK